MTFSFILIQKWLLKYTLISHDRKYNKYISENLLFKYAAYNVFPFFSNDFFIFMNRKMKLWHYRITENVLQMKYNRIYKH